MNPEVLLSPVTGVVIGLVGLVAIAAAVVTTYSRMYQKAGPAEVLVVSGRGPKPALAIGSGVLVLPVLQRAQRMSLAPIPVTLEVPSGFSVQAPDTVVRALGMVRPDLSSTDSLHRAVERFLDRTPEQVADLVRPPLESAVRAECGLVASEELPRRAGAIADRVREAVAADLERMGLVLESFALTDFRPADRG